MQDINPHIQSACENSFKQFGVSASFKMLKHPQSLEENLSITTGHCDLAIATRARKMHKKYQYDCQLKYFS